MACDLLSESARLKGLIFKVPNGANSMSRVVKIIAALGVMAAVSGCAHDWHCKHFGHHCPAPAVVKKG
jgi:hypothetical protein